MARVSNMPRRRFRFGLGALFLFVAFCAILFAIWRPQNPSRTQWQQITPGTKSEEVVRLMGTADHTQKLGDRSVNQYQVPDGLWLTITIRNDRVIETGISDNAKAE
jgi:hypothetical protein